MIELVYATVTVASWGTWIGVSQTAKAHSNDVKAMYVAVGNLVLAGLVVLVHRETATAISWDLFWPPFVGGLVWVLGNLCAFISTTHIGIARAAGTWTPLNIAMGFVWGVLLFGEFSDASHGQLGALAAALLLVVAGLLLIVFAKGVSDAVKGEKLPAGLAAAGAAGVLWGSYFVPAQASATSPWVANFPLALGMLAGGVILVLVRRNAPTLPSGRDYAIILSAGVLWGVGNLGMLLLVETVGTGKGFTIAQLSLLVNALMGIYLFRDPAPRSRAAAMTVLGVLLAAGGGVLLSNLK
jgi:glucose uptake protein